METIVSKYGTTLKKYLIGNNDNN